MSNAVRRLFFLNVVSLFAILVISGCTARQAPVTVQPPADQVSDRYAKNADQMAADGRYNTSNFLYKKAIAKYEKLEVWEKAIKCYIKLGDNFQKLGDVESALGTLNHALDVSKSRLGFQNLELAKGFQKLAFKYLRDKEFDRALELYKKALAIQLEVLGKNHPEVAKTYNSIALIYWHKKQPVDAEMNYLKSYGIKLRQFAGVPEDADKKFHIMDGGGKYKKGEFRKARDHFNRTVDEYQRLYGQNNPLFTLLYEQIGILHALEGNYEGALEYIRKAFSIRLDVYGDLTSEAAVGYLNMGICLRLKGDYEEALRFLNTGLRIKSEILGKFHPETADIYYQVGNLYYQRLQLDEALSFFQRSLMALVPGFNEGRITTNPSLDPVSPKDKLLEVLTAKANTLRMKYLQHPEQTEALYSAFSTYSLISRLVETMRRGYKSESYKLIFGEQIHPIYQKAIHTALMLYDITGNPGYKEAAFVLSEKSKAVVLAEALNEARAKQFADIPEPLLEKEENLKKELTHYDTYLQKEYYKKNPDPTKTRNLEEHYYTLKLEYLRLIDHFEKNYKKYHDLKYKFPAVNVKKIQQSLDPDTAIMEYFIGDNLLHIFVLWDKGLEVEDIILDENLNQLVADYNRAIKKIEEGPFLQLSWKLYRLLHQPVRHLVRQKEKLIIIPDGPLYTIPFESLISGASESSSLSQRDFLVNHFALSYHYSANLWLYSAGQAAAGKETAFIGFAPVFGKEIRNGYILVNDPGPVLTDQDQRHGISNSKLRDLPGDPGSSVSQLPATEEELRAIIRLFESQRKKAVGYFHRQASEDNFKTANIQDYDLIHIATHSLKDEGQHQLSGLIFSSPGVNRQPGEDGILYSGEIYNLHLDAQLIVLSSCESGVGKLIKGEGVMAMNRGFFYSGIRNIVFSLWKVEDRSTSRLMIEFYRNILQGYPFSQALREAKLEMIKDPFTAFPKYWSGFILVGK
jgi:CHAT domain-containing protein/tetratricopeptide (TPR) repeat protein